MGIAVALVIALAACGGEPSASSTASEEIEPSAGAGAQSAEPSAAADIVRGGVLEVLLKQDEGQGFDPAIATFSTTFVVIQQMYDTLAEILPSGELVPLLAEEWTVSEDGLVYTIALRDGVMFHNGREMVAADVKHTIERIMDPATLSPRATLYEAVESIDAPDDYTVVITLTEPFAPLMSALADVTAGIVPPEADDLVNNPIGTGAFQLKEWVQGELIEVEAFQDYWDGDKPYLDGIAFTFSQDDNARAASIRSPDGVDFLYDGPVSLWSVLEDDPEVTVHSPPGQLSWLYLTINVQKAPFDDVAVRQALYWAIDREEIAAVCQPPPTGAPLNSGFLPPSHWAGNDEELYAQDYDRARDLLTEAGLGDGFSFTLNALAGWDFHICAAQTIQQQLLPINVTANVEIKEIGIMVDELNAPDKTSDEAYQTSVWGFSATIDPDERFKQSFLAGGGTNFAGFDDAEVDELARQARQTTDRDERATLYREAQTRLADIGPMAFLFNYYKYDGTTPDVMGYEFNPQLISYRQLQDVWLDR